MIRSMERKNMADPKNPEPSRSKRMFRVPIPSEKSRILGMGVSKNRGGPPKSSILKGFSMK